MEKETKLTKNEFTIFVINLRPKIKVASLYSMRKLKKKYDLLKKSNTQQKSLKEKIKELEDQLKAIKSFEHSDIAKFVALVQKPLDTVINDTSASTEQKALTRIAYEKCIQKEIKDFRSKYPNWEKEIPNIIKTLGIKYREKRLAKLSNKGKKDKVLESERKLLVLLNEAVGLGVDPQLLEEMKNSDKVSYLKMMKKTKKDEEKLKTKSQVIKKVNKKKVEVKDNKEEEERKNLPVKITSIFENVDDNDDEKMEEEEDEDKSEGEENSEDGEEMEDDEDDEDNSEDEKEMEDDDSEDEEKKEIELKEKTLKIVNPLQNKSKIIKNTENTSKIVNNNNNINIISIKNKKEENVKEMEDQIFELLNQNKNKNKPKIIKQNKNLKNIVDKKASINNNNNKRKTKDFADLKEPSPALNPSKKIKLLKPLSKNKKLDQNSSKNLCDLVIENEITKSQNKGTSKVTILNLNKIGKIGNKNEDKTESDLLKRGEQRCNSSESEDEEFLKNRSVTTNKKKKKSGDSFFLGRMETAHSHSESDSEGEDETEDRAGLKPMLINRWKRKPLNEEDSGYDSSKFFKRKVFRGGDDVKNVNSEGSRGGFRRRGGGERGFRGGRGNFRDSSKSFDRREGFSERGKGRGGSERGFRGGRGRGSFGNRGRDEDFEKRGQQNFRGRGRDHLGDNDRRKNFSGDNKRVFAGKRDHKQVKRREDNRKGTSFSQSSNFISLGKRKASNNSKDSESLLHPSWLAKKAQMEKVASTTFQGKKIVFDDD